MDKKTKEYINDYANKIVSRKSWMEAIRMQPGMYIGALRKDGFMNMIREITQNSIDEIMKPMSPCSKIYMEYDERIKKVIVEDNGTGIPFDKLEDVFTKQHTSSNYLKKEGEYSSGLNGVGAKVVNALSTLFVVESYRYDGTAKRIEFSKGQAAKPPFDIPNKNKKQGTHVEFICDTDILGEFYLEWRQVYDLFFKIISLTPIKSELDLKAIDINGNTFTENIVNENGILSNIISITDKPLISPISIHNDDMHNKIDAIFTYDRAGLTDSGEKPIISSFANFCPTSSGSHVEGFKKGLSKWILRYMNNIYLKNKKSKMIEADVYVGLRLFISVASLKPEFIGQSKEQFNNSDIVDFIINSVSVHMDNWSKNSPGDIKKLCSYFEDIIKIRMNKTKTSESIQIKYTSGDAFSGMPKKYSGCTDKSNGELFIVEGDSAGGAAKLSRDVDHQAIFPIRGKIKNALKHPKSAIFANEECAGLINSTLGGKAWRKNFSIDDVPWRAIISMTDADIDGSHINALILILYTMYMPQVIEAGRLYRTLAPLYGIPSGKSQKFFFDRMDAQKYIKDSFTKAYSISKVNDQIVSDNELINILSVNIDYVYELEKISIVYACDPNLLEIVLFNKIENKTISNLKKVINASYRFVNRFSQYENSVIIEVISEQTGTIQSIYITDKLLDQCSRIIRIIKNNDQWFYKCNGEILSLYSFMKLFEGKSPKNMIRYKGLGEMNADILEQSTMKPKEFGGERTLIRYTTDDINSEIEKIRILQSDFSKLLYDSNGNNESFNRMDLIG